jgi:hypothetical protein
MKVVESKKDQKMKIIAVVYRTFLSRAMIPNTLMNESDDITNRLF